MTRGGTKNCGQCQCRVHNTNCFAITGEGTTEKPYLPDAILDPGTDNLLECSVSGFAGFLPPVYLDPPACHVYATFDQTIAFEAAQILLFDSERYDTDDMHDKENHSGRITFNTDGIYLVTLNLRWSKLDSSSGDLAAFIRKNGAAFLALESMPMVSSGTYGKHSLSVETSFEAGEYVEAMAKQDIILDGEPQPLRITVERWSPVFAAIYLRDLP